MLHGEAAGLLLGAVALGGIHGIEPGHGWPVAASYALDRRNTWLSGFAASLLIGVGHLVSSIAMVGVFFYAKSYFELTQVNEPVSVGGTVTVGGPVSIVAGVLLVALGVREYTHGHGHSHGDGLDDAPGHEGDHSHEHGDHSHEHDHSDGSDHSHGQAGGIRARIGRFLPFVGGDGHAHAAPEPGADRGLVGIAWFAFVLGFAHEEEFEIIALCAGSTHCLALMTAYALTVIVGIVGLTLLLIAGYEHFESEVERYTPYLPVLSAVVLVGMGLGFITGLL